MKVTIEPELAKRKPLAQIVEAALPPLERVLGRAAPRVTTAWDFRSDEHGQPKLILTISDTLAGQGSREFSPEELKSADEAWERFHRFWGTLLRDASDRHMQALAATLAQE